MADPRRLLYISIFFVKYIFFWKAISGIYRICYKEVNRITFCHLISPAHIISLIILLRSTVFKLSISIDLCIYHL
ncbi:hypothetical protein BDB00DRAFT_805870 [Zychaea mexicana]|uniref:uncharacterized protein n=1 Tax=Zychaea mexicana TaxID=64656 RepID=UPI0022FE7752|nr:uncharacterized protein BDB00DRAFT_805870 [Zychaea mexicana]KAI9497299.1 hypothetical protein BDB00DRAFT_805870 [Zychaea mexicana]